MVPPSCEMYHSYARVPGSLRAPETISSINSLNVSSAPSLTANSFTQEMCPFIAFSFARRPNKSEEIDSGVVAGLANQRQRRNEARKSRGHCIFTQQLVRAVGRIADIGVHLGAVVEDSAGVRVGAKSPLAVVLAHPGVSDAPEWQVRNEWLD